MMGWIIWLVIAAVLLVAEVFTLTFYLLWLGIGTLVGGLVALVLPDAYLVQVVLAGVTALALTVFTKPLTKKLRSSRGFRDAIDDLIGKQGVVMEGTGENGLGIVRIGNETWSARSDAPLIPGEQVIIVHRGSTVVEVQKWGGM
ncbi:NfeD family protein [Gorillibacterium timonense]|uniref:NfeD family protein n=1 Tax=Gorillibacterium timonense TaxID=1689269 RepID=UPI00071CECD3|nr:NfeD family protein [Gorillibacterium timonense]